MVIVSTRDFRSNQSYYLDMVNRGESVILRSRAGNFRITPVSENDLIKERDLVTDLRNSLIEVKEVLAGNKLFSPLIISLKNCNIRAIHCRGFIVVCE